MINLYKSVFLVVVVCLGVHFGNALGPQVINCTPLFKSPAPYKVDGETYTKEFTQSPQYSLACTVSSVVWSVLFMAGLTAMFTGLLDSVDVLKDEECSSPA